MGGSALTEVLLSRGHTVTGISRTAGARADRAGLTHVSGDIFDIAGLTEAIRDHDVVVSTFCGGHEVDLSVYYRQVEGTRRLLAAFQRANGSYLIYVGGAASLFVASGLQMFDDPRFPEWYFGMLPPAHLRWLGEITGKEFFHEAAKRKEDGVVAPGRTDPELAANVKSFTRVPLLEGCRAALELMAGRSHFRWSFLSPPWQYRPGEATGGYRLGVDYLIFENGVPSGIAVPDLALALADEVENQAFVHKHWTVAGSMPD